jgi:hypothetical protein
MTIKELYKYATKKKIEDYEVEIQYCDGGGFYYGTRGLKEENIDVDEKDNTKIVLI